MTIAGIHQSTQANTEDQNIKEVQKEVKKSEASHDVISSMGDTLSISERGKTANTKMTNLQEEEIVDSVDGKVIKKFVNEE